MQEPLATLIEALLYIHSFFIFKKMCILLKFIYLSNFVVGVTNFVVIVTNQRISVYTFIFHI